MLLLIAGSNSITDFDLTDYIPPETHHILNGGVNDIDRLAAEYADKHGMGKGTFRPQYALLGESANMVRTELMVVLAGHVLIIWDGVSTDTEYTLTLAKEWNKPITLIEYKQGHAKKL